MSGLNIVFILEQLHHGSKHGHVHRKREDRYVTATQAPLLSLSFIFLEENILERSRYLWPERRRRKR